MDRGLGERGWWRRAAGIGGRRGGVTMHWNLDSIKFGR